MTVEWKFTKMARDHAERGGFAPEVMLGSIPSFLSADDPADAVTQIDRAYDQFGGWRDSAKWRIDYVNGRAHYPGDPPRVLIAEARLRDELILFFNGAYIAVMQPDGSHRMARID
mgnify:CR=1 FL=1